MPVTLVNAYCTEAQVRAELQDIAATVNSDLICKAINVASREIDNVCSGDVPRSRRFWQDTAVQTRTYTCEDLTFVYVDDISTVTGLIVKTDDNDDGTYETTWTINTDFALWPLNAAADAAEPYAFWKIVAVGGGTGDKRFPLYERRAGLQITAKFGWPAIPKQIEEACILRAISILLRKDSPTGMLVQGEWGNMRVPMFDPDVNAMLRPFIKRRPYSVSYQSDQARNSLFHRWG